MRTTIIIFNKSDGIVDCFLFFFKWKSLFFFQIVVDDYAQSFRDVLSFEKSNPKDPKVLKAFSEAVHKVRERHTNTVIIMAEAVMEMKNNAQRHGQSNGQFGCGILKMVHSEFLEYWNTQKSVWRIW